MTIDSLTLAGRLAKDRHRKSTDARDKFHSAKESAAYYYRAYKLSSQLYPAINAATMYLLCDRNAQAIELATYVKKHCENLALSTNKDYWLWATYAESLLILGETEKAEYHYRRASDLATPNYGDIAAMRKQVQLLRGAIDVDDSILVAVEIPSIVTFSGHMVDVADREQIRFPADIEAPVRLAIRDVLEKLGVEFGYCWLESLYAR